MERPNAEPVIVTAWCKLLLIEGPLKATDFLLVTDHFIDGLMCSKIPDKDVFVSGSTGNNVEVVPSERADTGSMSFIRMKKSLLNTVPQLYLSWMGSNSEGISSGVEIGTGDHILIADIDQPDDLWVSCIPEVHGVAEPDGQEIGHGPVNEIKVVVVVEAGRV